MLGLIFIVLLIGLALLVLFWAGTLWLQGYLYSEPAADLYWRAPAAAAALAAFLALLSFLAYRQLGTMNPLDFSPKVDRKYSRIWSVEQGKEEGVLYERRESGSLLSGTEYVTAGGQQPRNWRRVDSENRLVKAIIVEEGDGSEKKKVRFKLKPPPGGKFREGEKAEYVEEGGRRVMIEDRIGQVTVTRAWPCVVYLLLNLVHLGLWFVCLWLLLRFQWPHALGLAIGSWLLVTFLLLPMLLDRVKQVAPPRAAPASTAALPGSPA